MKLLGGILLLVSTAAAAQWPGDQKIPPVYYPTIARQAATLEGFVPKEWTLEAKAIGDLNGDTRPDAALVLHMASPRNRISPSWDPNTKYDTNPRMLVVAFARKAGGYALAAADYKLIPRRENPNQDEPFDEVKIVSSTLRVKMHLFLEAGGWRMGGTAFTFRWQDGAFRLIGLDRDSVFKNSGETEEVSINYLTGRKLTKKGNMGSAEETRSTETLPKKKLLALGEIGDGLMFDPNEH
jgi:hypothetical protein